MATKVKGDAIKEGSIPLSALSNEVKDKIENAGGGADWNAQENEKGYIENRTHYINTKEGVEHTLSDLDYIDINEDGGKEWYYHGGLNNFGIAFKDYAGVLKYIDIVSKEKVVYKDPDDSAIALTVKQVIEEDDATIVFRAEYSGFNNFKFLLFENVDNPIVTLDPQYIPYTIARKTDIPNDIIKTTPQTLSNTAKNQVLTNLGINEKLDKLVNITYSELKSLRNNSQLKPGMFYRITDYVTTTAQESSVSAGHQFDIIVLALTANKLSEQAHAAIHEGDTYFSEAGANLSAWKIWYSLDNDDERFAWARYRFAMLKNVRDESGLYNNGQILSLTDYAEPIYVEGDEVRFYHDGVDGVLPMSVDGTVYNEDGNSFAKYEEIQGKGVIYRMIDEWGNDCPYDFKNVQFMRGIYTEGGGIEKETGDGDHIVFCYTFSWEDDEKDIMDASLVGNNGTKLNDEGLTSGVYNNVIKSYFHYSESGKKSQLLNDIVFFSSYGYEYGLFYGCNSNTFGNNCHNNTFGDLCELNTFGNICIFNFFGRGCTNNTFGNYITKNTFGDYCEDNTFGNECGYNTLGEECKHNAFGNGCAHNTLGNNCSYNTFLVGFRGGNVQANTSKVCGGHDSKDAAILKNIFD